MNALLNHIWCNDSIWGGEFDCRCLVTIDMIKDDKSYYDEDSRDPDWEALIDEDVEYGADRKEFPYYPETNRLKPEVVQWLNDNIKDVNDADGEGVYRNDNTTKAWAVGSDKYNARSEVSFSIFFSRRNDAMKFIKQWSHYKNPVDYLNYFKDIRRKLNFETGKMQRAERYNP